LAVENKDDDDDDNDVDDENREDDDDDEVSHKKYLQICISKFTLNRKWWALLRVCVVWRRRQEGVVCCMGRWREKKKMEKLI